MGNSIYGGGHAVYDVPARKPRHNDEERRQWVLNDEGLYNMMIGSCQSERAWIRANRALIDEVIDTVISGAKPAHYLAYGR